MLHTGDYSHVKMVSRVLKQEDKRVMGNYKIITFVEDLQGREGMSIYLRDNLEGDNLYEGGRTKKDGVEYEKYWEELKAYIPGLEFGEQITVD